MSYMFRLPFAAGNVFSASMLDTLLYQVWHVCHIFTIFSVILYVLGPVVKSVVSLTSLLRGQLVKCLTTL